MKKIFLVLTLTIPTLKSFTQTQTRKQTVNCESPKNQNPIPTSSGMSKKSSSDNYGAEPEVDTRVFLGSISSFPVGEFRKTNKFETGAEVRMSVGVSEGLDATFSIGYFRDFSGDRSNNFSQTTFKLGLKYYIVSGEYEYDGLYLGMNAGGSFGSKEINGYEDFKNKLIYSPYIGYTWKRLDFDAIVNNMVYGNSKKLISFGAGVAYRL